MSIFKKDFDYDFDFFHNLIMSKFKENKIHKMFKCKRDAKNKNKKERKREKKKTLGRPNNPSGVCGAWHLPTKSAYRPAMLHRAISIWIFGRQVRTNWAFIICFFFQLWLGEWPRDPSYKNKQKNKSQKNKNNIKFDEKIVSKNSTAHTNQKWVECVSDFLQFKGIS
jgi:hypothetical protein